MVQFESKDEILSDQIRDMTGLPAGQAIRVSAAELPSSGPPEPASNVVDAAIGHSAAIREAENVRRAREHVLKGARGAYWPSIDLIGQYSVLSKINNYDQFFKSFQRNNVNGGIEVTIPIFSART